MPAPDLPAPAADDDRLDGPPADLAGLPRRELLSALLHRLWTKAVGTPGYIKADWRCLEAIVVGEPPAADDDNAPRHSPEPWYHDPYRGGVLVEAPGAANDEQPICVCRGPDARQNAKRIVAAVNFCAGVPTADLADGSLAAERAARHKAEERVAELMGHLQEVVWVAESLGKEKLSSGYRRSLEEAKRVSESGLLP